MKKKRLCLIIAAMILSLTACGGQAQSGSSSGSTSVSNESNFSAENTGVVTSADELAFPLGEMFIFHL